METCRELRTRESTLMDPLETRDIEKILQSLDNPIVQQKICDVLVALPLSAGEFKLVPKLNVSQPEEQS